MPRRLLLYILLHLYYPWNIKGNLQGPAAHPLLEVALHGRPAGAASPPGEGLGTRPRACPDGGQREARHEDNVPRKAPVLLTKTRKWSLRI